MNGDNLPKINAQYVDKNGILHNIREIAFNKDSILHIGKFVAETKREDNFFFNESDMVKDGVYIFQSLENPNIAYRISKEYSAYGFQNYDDDILIGKLQEKQSKIKLSKFPTGVVTLDGRIIGQEIPYFENTITLAELGKRKDRNFNIFIYRQVLNILKELYDNEIIYYDNHPKNFVIGLNNKIELIDFERSFISFECNEWALSRLLENNCSLINYLNNAFNLNNILGDFLSTNNFEDSYIQLEEMEKKYQKSLKS